MKTKVWYAVYYTDCEGEDYRQATVKHFKSEAELETWLDNTSDDIDETGEFDLKELE